MAGYSRMLFAFCFLMASACSHVPDAVPASGLDAATAEQEVLGLLNARSDAVVAGDMLALEKLLDREFRYINIWGNVQDRDGYLQERLSMTTATDHWINQTMDDVRFSLIHPDIATVTFRAIDHFMYQSVEYRNPVRSTYVLRKADGRWLFLLGHTTNIASEK